MSMFLAHLTPFMRQVVNLSSQSARRRIKHYMFDMAICTAYSLENVIINFTSHYYLVYVHWEDKLLAT